MKIWIQLHGACSLIKKEFLIENGMYDKVLIARWI